MKCRTVNKNLVQYYNKELSVAKDEAIRNHIKNCTSCYRLYRELEATYNLIEKKEVLKPNPFLYTRINQKLENIKNGKNQPYFIPVYKKVLQPILLSFFILIGIVGGIKLGNISAAQPEKQLLVSQTTEFYLNDLKQEKIEAFLLK